MSRWPQSWSLNKARALREHWRNDESWKSRAGATLQVSVIQNRKLVHLDCGVYGKKNASDEVGEVGLGQIMGALHNLCDKWDFLKNPMALEHFQGECQAWPDSYFWKIILEVVWKVHSVCMWDATSIWIRLYLLSTWLGIRWYFWMQKLEDLWDFFFFFFWRLWL